MKSSNKYQAVIDRFEGQIAVLLVGQDETKLEVLRQLLPDGAKEGDIMTLEFKRAPAKTAKAKADVAAMIERLRKR